jgi:predicted secreted protein
MKYFFQHFIIFMVVLSVIGMANAFATVYLEKKHDGDIVKLAPGDALIITLKSNPTTGEIKLVLGYRRPWEKGVKPLNTFYVIVKVITPNPAH